MINPPINPLQTSSKDVVTTIGAILLVAGIALLVSSIIIHFSKQSSYNYFGSELPGTKALSDKVFVPLGKGMGTFKTDPIPFYIGIGIAGGGVVTLILSRFFPSNGAYVYS